MKKRGISPISKRAQMKLSFGMIFSIFLIIIFLAFAIYAIIKFINMQHVIQIETFKNSLQADINLVWQSSGESSYPKEYRLPTKINAICFLEDDYQNLMFESDSLIDGDYIENIDIDFITSEGEGDSFCIPNIEGKVKMTLVKDYGDTLVKITQ